MKHILYILLSTVFFTVAFCGCTTPLGNTLCISEVQSTGNDWVELYNYGTAPVSLQGWYLSDDPDTPGKYGLPALTLQPQEYLVVGTETSPLPFGLSAAGDTLVLSAPNGTPAQTVDIPAAVSGLSYGCKDETVFPATFGWYAVPTPGAANSEGMLLGDTATANAYGIRINEYMSRNRSVLYDRDGDYGDWIELYNFSDNTVDLSGYALTDTEDDRARWTFPQGTTVKAGGYLVVFCSGKNRTDGELHTDFRLGEGDDHVALYTADGTFCSGISCRDREQNISYGCDADGNIVRCTIPTPGTENVTEVSAP